MHQDKKSPHEWLQGFLTFIAHATGAPAPCMPIWGRRTPWAEEEKVPALKRGLDVRVFVL